MPKRRPLKWIDKKQGGGEKKNFQGPIPGGNPEGGSYKEGMRRGTVNKWRPRTRRYTRATSGKIKTVSP